LEPRRVGEGQSLHWLEEEERPVAAATNE